jgi:nucleoside-diphosphate-sugar epimerase
MLVLDAHRNGRLWATAIRPDVIYGKRDRHFTPRAARLFSTRLAPMLRGGRTTLQIVHAANVADAAVRAIATDVAGGKAYNTANDFDVTVREFVRLAGVGLGHRIVPIPVPMWIARAALVAVRTAVSLTRGSGPAALTSTSLDFLSRDNPFSSELAKRELGWSPPVPPEVGIPETFRWWKTGHA